MPYSMPHRMRLSYIFKAAFIHFQKCENTNFPACVRSLSVHARFTGVPGLSAAEVSSLSQSDQFAQLMPFLCRKFSHVSLSLVNTPPLPSARLTPHSLTKTASPLLCASEMRCRSH